MIKAIVFVIKVLRILFCFKVPLPDNQQVRIGHTLPQDISILSLLALFILIKACVRFFHGTLNVSHLVGTLWSKQHQVSRPTISYLLYPHAAMAPRVHQNLPPLNTSYGNEYEPLPSIRSSVSTQSTVTLPSPSLLAARAYYLDQTTPIGQKLNAIQRRKSLFEVREIPRRHSVLAAPVKLATRVATLNIVSSDQDLPPTADTAATAASIKVEEPDEVPTFSVKQNDIAKVQNVAARRVSYVQAEEVLRRVPFQYTHDHLRDWGHVYFGNASTADVFVNPLSLRRPSLTLVKDEDGEKAQSTGLVTIRARVLPKAKERKAFLIQRQFDIDELRASIPGEKKQNERPPLRRSSRARRSSVQQTQSSVRTRPSVQTKKHPVSLANTAVPIRMSLLQKEKCAANVHRRRIRTTLPACPRSIDALRARSQRRYHRSSDAISGMLA
jgi:hypothetical protein